MPKSFALFGTGFLLLGILVACDGAPAPTLSTPLSATEVPPLAYPATPTIASPRNLPPTVVLSQLPMSATGQPVSSLPSPGSPPPRASVTPRGCERLPTTIRASSGEVGSAEKPLVIAFEPYRERDRTVVAAKRLADCLSQMTGLVVRSTVGATSAAVIQEMGAHRAHVGFLDTPSILEGRAKYQFRTGLVMLRGFQDEQEPYYRSQFIAARSTGIKSISDLRGKIFCFGGPDPALSAIVPRIILLANGINPDRDLRASPFVGFADQVAVAVYRGECDAGVTFVDVLTEPAISLNKHFPDLLDKVAVFYLTEPIPNDGVQIVNDLDSRIAQVVTDALFALAPPGSAKREPFVSFNKMEAFIPPTGDPYLAFEATLKKAGVDPATLVK